MSERKKYPRIEDKINDFLTGEKLENALDFVGYLQANGLSFAQHDEYGYGWGIDSEKNKGIAFVKIPAEEKELWIWTGGLFDTECSADEELNETIWANVVVCPQTSCPEKRHCGSEEIGGKIFGKEFKSTCYAPLGFFNPDAKTLENLKKLLLLLK